MKSPIKSFIPFTVFLLFPFLACNSSGGYEPPRNVTLNLPEKIHIEGHGDYSHTAFVLVKDGNEYYTKADTVYSSDRFEVYCKRDLEVPVVFAGEEYAQGYITARWAYQESGDAWQCAEHDTNYSSYHANDHNNHVWHTAYGELTSGYSDVNSSLDSMTINQLEDQTLTIGINQVACEVWECIFRYQETYSQSVYWFAKDTGVALKGLTVHDELENVYTSGHLDFEVTLYEVGIDMATVLSHFDEPRPKYTFEDKYH